MKKMLLGFVIALSGVAVHMTALALTDRWVSHFPSVPDVLLDRWPALNLFSVGEIFFFSVIALITYQIVRYRWRQLPSLLTSIGMYYACRGIFLLFLPIGPPAGALTSAHRFVLYPYATHAYFPGGHIGVLFLLALSVKSELWRRILYILVIIFGLGSMLTKAHYTADIFGGLLLGYGVHVWSQRHLSAWWTVQTPKEG